MRVEKIILIAKGEPGVNLKFLKRAQEIIFIHLEGIREFRVRESLSGMFLALTNVLDFMSRCGIQKNFSGEEKVKKIFISCFIVVALLQIAFMAGCNTSSPSGPGGPTATPTNSPTPGPTATPQAGQLTVNLNSADGFVVLGHTQVTNSGPTALCGDLGLWPGTSTGGGYTYNCGGVRHATDTAAQNAQSDLTIAYNDAAGRTTPALVAGNLGGQTLYPGLYKSTGSLMISSGTLTLDALGDSNAVFIFQIASTLTVTSGRQVILAGGAKAANVFWQVGTMCALGTTASFKGTIMAHTSVTMNTGAVLEGRALAQTGQVTMLSNTITKPAP